VLLAHFVTEGLFFWVWQVVISGIDGFKKFSILVALDKLFDSQDKQATTGDFQFMGKGVNLFKEGLLNRDRSLNSHWLYLSFCY